MHLDSKNRIICAQEKTPVRFCFCVLNCGDMDYNWGKEKVVFKDTLRGGGL